MPALGKHAVPPLLGQAERLTAPGAPLREKDFTIHDDTKFPVSRPAHERASRLAPEAAHSPQRTDIIWCLLMWAV
jgi:hypothetical protein